MCFDDLDFETDYGYCRCTPAGSQYYCEWIVKCAVQGNPYCIGLTPRDDMTNCDDGPSNSRPNDRSAPKGNP